MKERGWRLLGLEVARTAGELSCTADVFTPADVGEEPEVRLWFDLRGTPSAPGSSDSIASDEGLSLSASAQGGPTEYWVHFSIPASAVPDLGVGAEPPLIHLEFSYKDNARLHLSVACPAPPPIQLPPPAADPLPLPVPIESPTVVIEATEAATEMTSPWVVGSFFYFGFALLSGGGPNGFFPAIFLIFAGLMLAYIGRDFRTPTQRLPVSTKVEAAPLSWNIRSLEAGWSRGGHRWELTLALPPETPPDLVGSVRLLQRSGALHSEDTAFADQNGVLRIPFTADYEKSAGDAPQIVTLVADCPEGALPVSQDKRILRARAELTVQSRNGTPLRLTCPFVFVPRSDRTSLVYSASPGDFAPRQGTHQRCQVCGEDLVQDLVACPACETPSHRDCWRYVGGCSTFGCHG